MLDFRKKWDGFTTLMMSEFGILIGGIGLVLLLFGLVAYLSHQDMTAFKATELSYRYTIYIEEYSRLKGEGFKENIPALAYDVVQDGERVHHYKSVSYTSTCRRTDKDGNRESYSCQKSKSVAVYANYFKWTANGWHEVSHVAATGKTDEQHITVPDRLPTPDLKRAYGVRCGVVVSTIPARQKGDEALGCQRQGSTTYENWVTVQWTLDKVESKTVCSVGRDLWNRLSRDDTGKAMYWSHNKVLDCSSLQFDKLAK